MYRSHFVYLFIYFLAIRNQCGWVFLYRFLCENMLLVFLSVYIYLEVELLGHMVSLRETFWGTVRLFSIAAAPFDFPASSVQEFRISLSCRLSTFVTVCLFYFSHISRVEIAHCGFLICISLTTPSVKHFPMYLFPVIFYYVKFNLSSQLVAHLDLAPIFAILSDHDWLRRSWECSLEPVLQKRKTKLLYILGQVTGPCSVCHDEPLRLSLNLISHLWVRVNFPHSCNPTQLSAQSVGLSQHHLPWGSSFPLGTLTKYSFILVFLIFSS